MAAEIELKKINEYVQECIAITSITGAYVYGIDSNGNSIKIAVEVLASAGTDYSQQITALTTKCNNNTTLITALQSAVSGKANSVHTHQISDVADLQTALDGKSNTGHTHTISDVANLQTALNGKADANHTHGMSAIVGLTDALNSKANSVHTHAIGDVANLQPTLANHEQRITDLEGQGGGGTVGNALKQVDLSTYSGGSNGEIVQHIGETTADYTNGYTYKCAAGAAEKTIPAGSQCIRLTQGGDEYISDGEADTTTDKMVMVLQPTAEGVTYNVFAAQTIAEIDIEKLVGCYVPDEIGAIHQITEITHTGTTLTSVTLDNGVTLEITSSTRTKSTLAWYEYFSKSGERFYGGSGTVGYMIASKDFVSAPSGDQFYPIATEKIGTAFGGTVQNFTASEDIVIRSVTWTQSPTQPETSVASGDNFLSQTDGAIGSTISIYYNSTNQHLELKGNGGAVAAYVDMAVFIKDGMLENVEKYTTPEQGVTVAVPYLKFTFNTDSGKSVIRISFADLIDTFDGSNVDLTSAFVKAATYSAPAIGDSMDVAIGKLLKGHEDNAAAIDTKQDTLTFDSTPTANSNNPVTSGGIKAAIDAVVGNVPNALKQKDLTTYQGTDGEIVQHIGATTANYTGGYVYKFDEVPSDYPSNTLAVRLNGTITNRDSNPINAAALIGNDRNYVKTTPTPYLSEDLATWFQFTERTTPIVGDGVVVEVSNTFDYGVITEIKEYSTKYYCTIQIGERSVHYYLPKESTLPTKYTFVNNSGQFIISRAANINEEYYLDNPSTSENRTYFVVANGNAYPIVAEEEWMGNSNLLPVQSGWQRINVQPSSEGAVSDLETRMTAAETAISGKQATITGAASTITTANLTASKILGSDANGKVAATSIATTDAEDAVAKRHTQNTDTQIVSGSNKVEVSASEIKLVYGSSGSVVIDQGSPTPRLSLNGVVFRGVSANFSGSVSIANNLSVSGDLNVTGKETVEEIVNIKSENNFITLRDGAQTAIASGSLSGTKVENYDGLGNDLLFGTDASGVFRIGDDGGTLEPIMTRDEAANLADGELLMWDATNQRAVKATMTGGRVLVTDGDGKISPTSNISSSELYQLDGVTSNIQTQLNAKAPSANTVNGAPLSNAASYFYGVSTSAANATQKEVSIPSITTLNAGQVIVVQATTTSDSIDNATLKLNDFTAYPIKYATLIQVNTTCWDANVPSAFVFDGQYWVFLCRGYDTAYRIMPVAEGIAGTATTSRVVRADYLQQIIHGQIDKFVGTRAQTEDAYWDLVSAGTVQADTLYITFDNDWED